MGIFLLRLICIEPDKLNICENILDKMSDDNTNASILFIVGRDLWSLRKIQRVCSYLGHGQI